MLIDAIKTLTYILVFAIWAAVGLYIAIPLVLVAFFVYVFGVMSAAFVEEKALLRRSKEFLNDAITMYPEGFRSIRRSVSGGIEEKDREEGEDSKKDEFGAFGGFMWLIIVGTFMIGFATFVWWLVLRLFGFTQIERFLLENISKLTEIKGFF